MLKLQHMLISLVLVYSFGAAAQTQVATGTPPFGSFGGGPDVINLGNLNAHITVPIFSRAGRGTNFQYVLSYDTSIWNPALVSGVNTWQPVLNWGWRGQTETATGYMSYSSRIVQTCYTLEGHIEVPTGEVESTSKWVYHDRFGVSHPFNISTTSHTGTCGSSVTTATQTATDGSGYTVNAAGGSGTITPPGGQSFVPPFNASSGTATFTDANGNQITVDGSGHFTDTLGTVALTVAGSGTPSSPTTFTYTAPSGANAAYSMNYTQYTVNTNFGVSGIAEYGPSSVALVSSISLPDGSSYSFTYEKTPGTCTPLSGTYSTNCVTGRLASVTFPTGGTINYTYNGGTNGINSDGSAAGMTRVLNPGGTWQYSRTHGSGSLWTTTVTDPNNNQTSITFAQDSNTSNPSSNFFELQRQAYQGTSTLLATNITCYNGNYTTCSTASVSSPITQLDSYRQLPNGTTAASEVTYNAYGLATEDKEYDYGVTTGSAPSSTYLRRDTVTTYASLGNGIVNKPSSVTVKDGLGNVVAESTLSYDQTGVTTTTNTPQHTAVSGSRGNLTTLSQNVQPGVNLSRTFTYYDTGTVNVSSDVNNAQTTYTYGACGNSFPTQISLPLSLSRSMAWNCTGGVMTSSTDENGQASSMAYTDSSFWRPSSTTDQASNTTNITYPSATAIDSSLSFNSGNSVVETLSTVDGFGRAVTGQQRQGPGTSTYDSTETDYDTVGNVSRATMPYSGTAGQTNSSAPGVAVSYDALGRPLTTTDGGNGTVTLVYTQNDVLRKIGPAPSGENLKQRQLEYDGLGRLSSVCEITSASGSGTCGQGTQQTGFWTKYTYDVLNDLLSVNQNAQATAQTRTFTYDGLGRITSEGNPESGLTSYTYDTDTTCGTSSGDLIKRADAVGNTTCYHYDLLHRVTSITYPTGSYSANTPTKTFVYDTVPTGYTIPYPKGRMTEAYTGSKTTDLVFNYSARGETTDAWESTPHSGGYYHVTTSYWANGAVNQLTGIGLPAITYGVDGEGRASTVSAASGQNPLTSTSYNLYAQPPQVAITLGSSDSDTFTYDGNTGRMTQYKFTVGSTPHSVIGNLTWNANGTLATLGITDPFNAANAQTCNYSYDDLSRIAGNPSGAAQYGVDCGSTIWRQYFTYDAFGNISKSVPTGSTGNSFQATYSTATNRLATIPGITPTYDANGNVTYDGNTYSWDSEGRALGINSVSATYDALGRMVEQNRSGSYTQIVYGPGGGKLALMSGQTLSKAFVPLPGGGTAVYNSSGLAYYRHSDWLGSSRFASTPTRTMYSDLAYAPFGENYAQAGTTDSSFTGQNQDTISGLNDFLFREYNTYGRWISPDPAGLGAADPTNPQTWNRYAYVINNPLAYTDLLGLQANCEQGRVNDDGCEAVLHQVGSGGFDGSQMGLTAFDVQLAQFFPGNSQLSNPETAFLASGSISWYSVQGGHLISTSYLWAPGYCPSVMEGGCGSSLGTLVPVQVDEGSVTSISGPGPNLVNGAANNESWFWTAASAFVSGFSVFGPKTDPRPSCFGGFLRDAVTNFVGVPGVDTLAAASSSYYGASQLFAPAVPNLRRLRGGLSASQWIAADEAARVTNAGTFGLVSNLVVSELQAIGNEVPSALSGGCK